MMRGQTKIYFFFILEILFIPKNPVRGRSLAGHC